MQPKRLRPECLQCLVGKQLPDFLKSQPLEKQLEYLQRVMKLLSEAPHTSTGPVIVNDIHKIRKEMFGYSQDFSEIKTYFNALMLEYEAEAARGIAEADDPLLCAIQYSLIGNYIDFSTQHAVKESELKDLLRKAQEMKLNADTYLRFKQEAQSSRKILLLTDNCGEIVLDKLLVQTLQKLNPTAQIIVMVRGEDVQNDATMKDAEQVGMTKVVQVIGNGNGIAGTWEPALSSEATDALESADMIIAKGQANFETLCHCGRNVYYLFLCKCYMFAELFGVPRLTPMIVHDSEC